MHLLKNGGLQDISEEESSQKYDPVQSLAYDHGVSLIPLAISPSSKDFTIGHHELQVIRHKNIWVPTHISVVIPVSICMFLHF